MCGEVTPRPRETPSHSPKLSPISCITEMALNHLRKVNTAPTITASSRQAFPPFWGRSLCLWATGVLDGFALSLIGALRTTGRGGISCGLISYFSRRLLTSEQIAEIRTPTRQIQAATRAMQNRAIIKSFCVIMPSMKNTAIAAIQIANAHDQRFVISFHPFRCSLSTPRGRNLRYRFADLHCHV